MLLLWWIPHHKGNFDWHICWIGADELRQEFPKQTFPWRGMNFITPTNTQGINLWLVGSHTFHTRKKKCTTLDSVTELKCHRIPGIALPCQSLFFYWPPYLTIFSIENKSQNSRSYTRLESGARRYPFSLWRLVRIHQDRRSSSVIGV